MSTAAPLRRGKEGKRKKMYAIIVQKSKYCRPDITGKIYYSKIYGLFCTYEQARKFSSFENAQPTVRKLRDAMPDLFFYTIFIKE